MWEREVVPQIERIVAWVVLLSRRGPLRLLRESAARQAASLVSYTYAIYLSESAVHTLSRDATESPYLTTEPILNALHPYTTVSTPIRSLAPQAARSSRCFVLLSPDFIVDANGQAFIEEMNVNGFMVGDDHFYHGQQDTLDALRVLGADGWPKRPLYESRASRLVDGFVREQGYDAHDEVRDNVSLRAYTRMAVRVC